MSSSPFEVTLADGSVVKAPNAEEAFKIVAKMKEDTSSALKEERTKREALEAQYTGLAGQVEQLRQQNAPKPSGNGGYDPQTYWKLANEDPMKAQNYLDSYRFGIQNPDDVPKTFQQMQEQVQRMHGDNLGLQFIQRHFEDFPATPENAKFLADRVKDLQAQGHPVNVDTLDLAYSKLIEEGKIKPMEKQRAADDQPNPSLSGSGQADIPEAELAKAEEMTTADLEKYLKSKGMIVGG
jgi:hypothetical protein